MRTIIHFLFIVGLWSVFGCTGSDCLQENQKQKTPQPKVDTNYNNPNRDIKPNKEVKWI